MNKQEIRDWITQVLIESFEIPAEQITPDANLYSDLDIDSIDAVDLLVKLKQVTGKQLSPETFKKVQTVDDVVEAIYSLMQE